MFRKLFLTAAAVISALSLSVNAYAGGYGKARAGLMAGVSSSSSNAKNVDAKSIGRYHIGLTAELPIAFGFAVQPSLLFQTKGTKLSDVGPEKFRLDTRAAYLEIPVQIQWGPDLMAFRPYVFAEPFVGYGLFAKAKSTKATRLRSSPILSTEPVWQDGNTDWDSVPVLTSGKSSSRSNISGTSAHCIQKAENE